MTFRFISLHLLLVFCSLIVMISCKPASESFEKEKESPVVISVPEGFIVEKLYEPNLHGQGSWVSVTKDDQGRLYTSDQYGNIYRVTLPDTQNNLDSVSVEKLDLTIGLAQGLLWHNGDLYALVNSNEKQELKIHSGFYKITDSNGDGELDDVKMLRSFDGEGEHGPHNIALAPDGLSLYLVLGNHTDIPEDLKSVVPKVWDEDNLLPVIKDPSGHANDRKAPGGWVVQTDFEGREWTLFSVGMRNTYDIAFNEDGELFGFDSDMEYDMGMPWYRPIRLCHLTSGSDFGWRTGTGKFLAEYPDNLPGIGNLGQGSPTGLMEGKGLKFPSHYQDGMYLFDWSYGTMYFASLTPSGSSYTSEIAEFLSGVPLPITNGIAGNDGAMYFLTGGRRLESGLYKVTYEGELSSEIVTIPEHEEGKKERQLRRELEALQGPHGLIKMELILDNLDHPDRFIRFAARAALEHQNYSVWKNKIKQSKSTLKTIAFSLAIARIGNDQDRIMAIQKLLGIDWTVLAEAQKIDYIRALDLLLIRMEDSIPAALEKRITAKFLPHYLTESDIMNKEMCALLSYLQVSEIIGPTVERMFSDTATADLKANYLSADISKRSERYGKDVEKMLQFMPNQQNISYAKSLSVINDGWAPEVREKYFRWYNEALKKSGGRTYSQFIKAIQQQALTNLPAEEREYFEALAGEAMNDSKNSMEGVKQPVGPGRNWTVEEVKTAYAKNKSTVNFANGANYFKATLCATCHSINGEGGNTGPELTQIGTRFSIPDLADAIINPSVTISDRYRNTTYHMKDGRLITGRVIDDEEDELEISTNAFSPDLTETIRKDRIEKEEESIHSSMPPGLVNRLNEQELSDLIAYMLSGGNEEHSIYKN